MQTLDAPRLEELTRLLGRQVDALETEHAPAAGLERVSALRFGDGARFPLPPGNRLRTGGDVAEIRALLAGWPRASAERLKQWVGPRAPAAAQGPIDTVLAAWAADPDLAQGDPRDWPASGGD